MALTGSAQPQEEYNSPPPPPPPPPVERAGISFLDGRVSVSEGRDAQRLTLVVQVHSDAECVLHWGLSRRPGASWQRPPESCWPPGTTPADGGAVRTPLTPHEKGEYEVAIPLDGGACRAATTSPSSSTFRAENRWLKNDGRDFCVSLPDRCALQEPGEALLAWLPGEDVTRQLFTVTGGARLAAAVR